MVVGTGVVRFRIASMDVCEGPIDGLGLGRVFLLRRRFPLDGMEIILVWGEGVMGSSAMPLRCFLSR